MTQMPKRKFTSPKPITKSQVTKIKAALKTRIEAMPEWLQEIINNNPDLILWDGLDTAVIGSAERCGMQTVLVYDYEKMADIFVKRDRMTREEAYDWINFNITGGYVGELTPMTFYPPLM